MGVGIFPPSLEVVSSSHLSPITIQGNPLEVSDVWRRPAPGAAGYTCLEQGMGGGNSASTPVLSFIGRLST